MITRGLEGRSEKCVKFFDTSFRSWLRDPLKEFQKLNPMARGIEPDRGVRLFDTLKLPSAQKPERFRQGGAARGRGGGQDRCKVFRRGRALLWHSSRCWSLVGATAYLMTGAACSASARSFEAKTTRYERVYKPGMNLTSGLPELAASPANSEIASLLSRFNSLHCRIGNLTPGLAESLPLLAHDSLRDSPKSGYFAANSRRGGQ